jgi:tRNA (guanine37-N1)-methyltransferase
MKITILTLFPDMFDGPFRESILKHAQTKGLVSIKLVNIRDFGIGSHKIVDDTTYGGGIGMVMRVDVLDTAIQAVRDPSCEKSEERIILLAAHGTQFHQQKAKELKSYKHLILICGHYEGVDERVKQFIDEEISIGDFITTGGEIPAMLLTDAVIRLLPGVLKDGATDNESFSIIHTEGIGLEYPHFTKPRAYKGMTVPEVLVSGNHAEIEKWRKTQSHNTTEKLRNDLLKLTDQG